MVVLGACYTHGRRINKFLLMRVSDRDKNVKIKIIWFKEHKYLGLQSFPGWFFSRKDDSRMVTFPERRFLGGHFPGWDNFLWLIYRHTLNMNNTLYKFIPRRKPNLLAHLTRQGYAKCQMLIFHHSSKTNELGNVQGPIKTASVSTFLSWPSLINYRY